MSEIFILRKNLIIVSELWISAKEWLGQRGQAGRGSEVDAVKIRMLPIQQFSHCTLGNSAHWGFSPLRCAPQFSALLPIRLRSRFSPRNLSAQPGLPSKTQVSQIFTRMLPNPMFMFPEEMILTCYLQPKLFTLPCNTISHNQPVHKSCHSGQQATSASQHNYFYTSQSKYNSYIPMLSFSVSFLIIKKRPKERKRQTSPQAKRHQPSLLITPITSLFQLL